MNSFSVDKGVTIRPPATANLMVDSADRNPVLDLSGIDISSPFDFTITRNQSLIQGFFNRIGTTEVVLEWYGDNVSSQLNNNTFAVQDSSGVTHTVTLPLSGAYTVQQTLDYIVYGLNNTAVPPITGYTFAIIGNNGLRQLANTAGLPPRFFRIMPGKLATQLDLWDLNIPSPLAPGFRIKNPDLRPHRYLDFTSEQLTAVQEVKDASTQPQVRDVLCRFYFADDAPNQLDSYGFPILLGYTPFVQRRLFNPPKQIKWDNNTPVGGYLRFTVYDDMGNIPNGTRLFQIVANTTTTFATYPTDTNWLMTLQLSEN